MKKKMVNVSARTKKLPIAVLVGAALVLFWRGVWGLADVYLFPSNHVLSLWTSVVLGLTILIINRKAIKSLM